MKYLSEVNSIGILESHHEGRYDGRGIQGLNVKTFSRDIVLKAHVYMLKNLDEVKPYLTAHKSLIKKKYLRMNEKWLLTEHNKTFITWFNESVPKESTCASETIKWLSCMSKFNVITWSAYDITRYSFYTKSKDGRSTMKNSGVMVKVESMYFSSAKNNNLVLASRAYFGFIEKIMEIYYVYFKASLFKCKWIENNTGVETNEL